LWDPDPDQKLEVMDPALDPELDLNLIKNHFKKIKLFDNDEL
jgi:hypothetical protein